MLQDIEALRMGIGGGEVQHHFRQRTSDGVALEITRETDVESPQIEGRQQV
jgi:hypothetical protein